MTIYIVSDKEYHTDYTQEDFLYVDSLWESEENAKKRQIELNNNYYNCHHMKKHCSPEEFFKLGLLASRIYPFRVED